VPDYFLAGSAFFSSFFAGSAFLAGADAAALAGSAFFAGSAAKAVRAKVEATIAIRVFIYSPKLLQNGTHVPSVCIMTVKH
jgi:hypothetical protein